MHNDGDAPASTLPLFSADMIVHRAGRSFCKKRSAVLELWRGASSPLWPN